MCMGLVLQSINCRNAWILGSQHPDHYLRDSSADEGMTFLFWNKQTRYSLEI
jgi:hypothetical protein